MGGQKCGYNECFIELVPLLGSYGSAVMPARPATIFLLECWVGFSLALTKSTAAQSVLSRLVMPPVTSRFGRLGGWLRRIGPFLCVHSRFVLC